jgi:hypothetical protein
LTGTSLRSKAEARSRLKRNLERRQRLDTTSGDTLAAYLERWLRDTAPLRLRPRSLEGKPV